MPPGDIGTADDVSLDLSVEQVSQDDSQGSPYSDANKICSKACKSSKESRSETGSDMNISNASGFMAQFLRPWQPATYVD